MSQGAASSASSLGKNAGPPSSTTPKLRSCIVCRNRKVRCDKQSPCSNCRRANIACVFPPVDRPPRWARRLERLSNDTATSNPPAPQDTDAALGKVMERVQNLENLVKELRGQLEQAHPASSPPGDGSSGVNPLESSTQQNELSPATDTSRVHKQFGRLVLQDARCRRYVSSGFWSHVNDELDGLRMDTRDLAGDGSDGSEDEASSAQEFERTAAERNAFLFGHNLALPASDVREFHPLPSQIPFLLDVFSENVNFFLRCVHMPTVTKMVRDLRHSGMRHLTPPNEALLFSMYYAAIVSMEEDDVMTNFGSPKTDLSLRYRSGLEHALAKADFLNFPDIVLVQALAIFLCLTRRYSSPRFVWMMTGLAIRMAQYLGLQRDGAHFKHLTPFEVETRRNIWWILCMLDVRTSEDQGTDLTITSGSFDTKIPLNINDADIDPESKKMPTERRGVTDMSFARISAKITDIMRQMMAPGVRDSSVADLEDQSPLLNKIYQNFEQEYFQHTTESGNIAYWVAVTLAKLVMAKMTLIVFLPVLFSPPSEEFSDEIRTKLLLSAIEVVEYNHALNAEPTCRQWRWLYQTCTHWHAIVYLLIEVSRRPWSTIVERAWVALHSRWLIPAPSPMDQNLRIWVPLRRLMHQAHKHRGAELSRLRAHPQAATALDIEDQKIPLPSSSGLFQTGSGGDIFRERWHQLMIIPDRPKENTKTSKIVDTELLDQQMLTIFTGQSTLSCSSAYRPDDLSPNMHPGANRQQASQTTEGTCELSLEQSFGSWPSMVLVDGADGATMESGSVPLLWNDAESSIGVFPDLDLNSIDVYMDLDGEVNWYDWIESAKGIE